MPARNPVGLGNPGLRAVGIRDRVGEAAFAIFVPARNAVRVNAPICRPIARVQILFAH
jgi:hypothetical protein